MEKKTEEVVGERKERWRVTHCSIKLLNGDRPQSSSAGNLRPGGDSDGHVNAENQASVRSYVRWAVSRYFLLTIKVTVQLCPSWT